MPTSPHWPVALSTTSLSLADTMLVARKWRRFPRRRPTGCDRLRQEHVWSWPEGNLAENLNGAWLEWEAEVEDYLCMVHDVPWEQIKQYVGRAAGFSFVRKPLSEVWAKHIHPQCSRSSKA
eukprot:4560933-Amphidinium_carterae.1